MVVSEGGRSSVSGGWGPAIAGCKTVYVYMCFCVGGGGSSSKMRVRMCVLANRTRAISAGGAVAAGGEAEAAAGERHSSSGGVIAGGVGDDSGSMASMCVWGGQ